MFVQIIYLIKYKTSTLDVQTGPKGLLPDKTAYFNKLSLNRQSLEEKRVQNDQNT